MVMAFLNSIGIILPMTISHTALIISCIITLAMSAVIGVIARNYPSHIHGLRSWAWGSFIIGIALCSVFVRDHLHPLFGIVIPNLMVLLAMMMLNAGTRRLAGQPPRDMGIGAGVFVSLFLGLLVWFTLIEPDLATRMIIVSLFILIVSVDHMAFCIWKLPNSIGRNLLLVSLLGLILTRLIRILTLTTGADQPISVFDDSIGQLLVTATPALLIPLATVSFLMLVSEHMSRELIHAVRHDDLTGCFNRNAGTQMLEQEIARADRYHTPLSVLFMDIDDFKEINDTHGHLTGDRVLRTFAEEVRKCMRNTDALIRFGGDEFLAILPNTTLEDASGLAQRIGQIGNAQPTIRWSVSLGIAQWLGESDQLERMLDRADQSAYQVKKDKAR
jgi:diguanylate cyclase (GGDEF)-like protein